MAQIFTPGTATASDVMAGKNFNAGVIWDGAGAIVERGAGGTVTPTSSAQTKLAGRYTSDITISGVTVPAAKVVNDTTIAGVTGTLPKITTHQAAQIIDATSVAGRIYQRPSASAWDGVSSVYSDDPDWVAANIRSGTSIFGLMGTLIPGKRSATGTVQSGSGVVNLGVSFVPTVLLASMLPIVSGRWAKSWINGQWVTYDGYSQDAWGMHTTKPTTTTIYLDTGTLPSEYFYYWMVIE
ncbi:hypothetical protein [Paenibacillus wynnii]|uniref:Uncharacterized protein n=1 Tax=Paenibacillus wynnii TaxID=268407 RepID=A0A098MDP9_9BACL|nr:hypothetical protein [Paenibacillus wynnii]KGE20690.1 hypothetical protein PWYN_00415 [Paenibacillus wynnii]